MDEDPELPVIPPPPWDGAAPRRIVCAAMKHNVTGTIIVGPRHFDKTMHMQIERCGGSAHWKALCEDGFIDQFGEFHNRQVSWLIAREAGQIWRVVGSQSDTLEGYDDLYSENLY
jgi:hypothetical protein